MKVVEWSDDTLRMCHEVLAATAIMGLFRTLAEGSASLRLIGMREAVSIGEYVRAAGLEAEARAWEDMPHLIEELAAAWRTRQ